MKRKPIPRYTFWTIAGTLFIIVGAGLLITGILSPNPLRLLEAAVYFGLGTVALIRLRHLPDSN
jgi:hypothetical protein